MMLDLVVDVKNNKKGDAGGGGKRASTVLGPSLMKVGAGGQGAPLPPVSIFCLIPAMDTIMLRPSPHCSQLSSLFPVA